MCISIISLIGATKYVWTTYFVAYFAQHWMQRTSNDIRVKSWVCVFNNLFGSLGMAFQFSNQEMSHPDGEGCSLTMCRQPGS